MPDPSERPAPATTPAPVPPPDGAAEFARLRHLLLGREQSAIAELQARMGSLEVTPEEMAEHLPEAIALRAGRDEQLARALAPTLESAFSESVHRNPQQIAQAIYPTLGPAIRKAITEAIAGLVAGINRALEESLSIRGLRWRIEAWRSGTPYAQIVMKHALVYRVEQAYLIHGETGLLLAHVTAPDLSAPDADVISGMLTAIRDFVGDSFEPTADGGLRTFSVGDVTVLVEAGPRALLAAVVRGQHPPSLLERLQETLEVLHLQFARQLAGFDGDTAPLAPAHPVLAECLETVVDTDRRRRRSLVPQIAWLVATVALLTVTASLWSAHRRWRRALGTLDAEPGLVVLRAERSWRTWRIDGLRDPLAGTPTVLLAGLGVDTTRVRGSWRPYVSAEAPVVLARAERTLEPPASVRLTLAGDTLIAEGTASTWWIDRAAARAGLIAGVGIYDPTLTPVVPEGVQATADSLTGTRILFSAGSAALSPETRPALRTLAAQWQRLHEAVGETWTVALDVTGRTDSTGSREVNRQLSDERAAQVAAQLAALGVPTTVLRPRGIGSTAQLPGTGPEARARVNRSVSFSIRLVPAVPTPEPRP